MLCCGVGREQIGYRQPFFPFLHKHEHIAATEIDCLAAHIERHVKVIGDHRCVAVNLDSWFKFFPVVDLGGLREVVPGIETGFPSLESFPIRCRLYLINTSYW